jgi:hypothetical protein
MKEENMSNVNTSMNIETTVFSYFKKYLEEKSVFNPKIFNATPKNLAVFPTVIFKETNNVQNLNGTTLDRTETINNITDTVEIYAKDMVINGQTHTRKEIINELKYLIFDFFQYWGFTRTQATEANLINLEVDRYIIIETCSLNNWNRKINL